MLVFHCNSKNVLPLCNGTVKYKKKKKKNQAGISFTQPLIVSLHGLRGCFAVTDWSAEPSMKQSQ